ncbi:ribbon-helix-helix domain-containing protein [Alkalinema pantanalense CENA528]|uniref:ribbon-helix-helix domain-containing protein n=1 Tax=Alkalinema pantanalense TaxID=1620705 RepID=UPI003D6FCC08
MNTFPINLNDNLTRYLQEKIASGHYSSPSDYIEALIQEDQARTTRLETLALEGINSGPSTPMTDDDWAYIRAQVRKNLGQS